MGLEAEVCCAGRGVKHVINAGVDSVKVIIPTSDLHPKRATFTTWALEATTVHWPVYG